MVNYILVLDDTRSIEDVQKMTPEPFTRLAGLPIVLCKDFKEAQMQTAKSDMAKSGALAAHICFDHNLYGSKNHMNFTGLDFANWLCHYDECRTQVLTDDFTFTTHTTDPQAAKEITEIMLEHQDDKKN